MISRAGYDLSPWRDTLLKLGQTRVFFSTTAMLPYRSESTKQLCFYWTAFLFLMDVFFCPARVEMSYRVDMVTWNQYLRWGVVYIRLHGGRTSTEVRLDQ